MTEMWIGVFIGQDIKKVYKTTKLNMACIIMVFNKIFTFWECIELAWHWNCTKELTKIHRGCKAEFILVELEKSFQIHEAVRP